MKVLIMTNKRKYILNNFHRHLGYGYPPPTHTHVRNNSEDRNLQSTTKTSFPFNLLTRSFLDLQSSILDHTILSWPSFINSTSYSLKCQNRNLIIKTFLHSFAGKFITTILQNKNVVVLFRIKLIKQYITFLKISACRSISSLL